MLLSGMISTVENLPDDVGELKEIIREITAQSQREILFLKEQISLLQAKIFGRRTEKYDLEQLLPGQSFLPGLESEGLVAATEPETIVVEKHTRRKTGRKPLPDNLPREEIIHDIPEDEKGMVRDYCYVGDVVRANLAALHKGSGDFFNIGTGKETRTLDLFNEIVHVFDRLGVPVPEHLRQMKKQLARPGDLKRSCLIAEKALRILDWRPEYRLPEGLEKTLKWRLEKSR